MKITAIPGTELESVFKQFYEQMKSEQELVLKVITEFTGVNPVNFGYYWIFGYTCKWAYDMVRFPENSNPAHMISYTINGKTYFKPNKRLIISKAFIKKWCETFKGLNGNILTKYGIPVMDDNSGRYVNWLPCYVNDKYGIVVPSSLLDYMPNIKNKQYNIEL